MKLFTLIIFTFISLIFKEEKVSVHVTYTNSYCGGAKPTREIEVKYNTPKLFPDYEIKLVHTINKKEILVKTDSLGNFSHKLISGKYQIFLTTKINKKIYTNYNPACAKMLNISYAELIIEQNKKNYEINLFFPCNLCEKSNKP